MNTHSYRFRLILYFGLLVVASVLLIVLSTMASIRRFYDRDQEQKFKEQADLNLTYFSRYIDFSKGLKEAILEDSATFFQYNTGHFQILSLDGQILLSTQAMNDLDVSMQDVRKSCRLNGYYSRIAPSSHLKGMSIITIEPISYHGEWLGYAVFENSLRETEEAIGTIKNTMTVIAVAVCCIALALTIFFSNAVVVPIRKLTRYANALARGDSHYRFHPSGPEETIQLGQTMIMMNEEIAERENVKNEFISNVSHELRTPLTSITGWAYTLREDSSDEFLLREGLDIIAAESDRLTGMVNDLLDFSRILSKEMHLELRAIDLNALLRGLEIQFLPRAIAEGKAFDVQYCEGFHGFEADSQKIRQVFINLLDNAFKFTPTGGKITLIAEAGEEDVVFTVADNGEGIDDEDGKHIFEKFYKGKSRKSHTGIGLSIAFEIVQMHHGSIHFESAIGKGTRFEIVLPKYQPEPA